MGQIGFKTCGISVIMLGFVLCYSSLLSFREKVFVLAENAAFKMMPLSLHALSKTDPTFAAFNLCNPSIVQREELFLVNTRAVNYHLPRYKKNNANEPRRNRNIIISYDFDFSFISEYELVPGVLAPEIAMFGLEDCRFFLWENETWMTFSYYAGEDKYLDSVTVAVCQIAFSKEKKQWEIAQMQVFERLEKSRPEKNWLPFIYENELHVIYSYNPFVVMHLSFESGAVQKKVERFYVDTPSKSFRGSGGPVPFNDGYLLLVHETEYSKRKGRRYYHRFVYTDKAFNMICYSQRFVFFKEGVEFSCGMCLDAQQEHLLIGIGVTDSSAYLCRMPLCWIQTLLDKGVAV